MKSRIQLVVGVLTAVCVSAAIVMAEDAVEQPKNAKAQGEAGVKPPAAKRLSGMLSEKPADAAAEVVAVLTAKDKTGAETKYNVTAADQAVADKVKALIGKTVTIKGELNADKTAIAATDAAEKVAKPAGEKKPKADTPPPPAL